jgi:hypothetical protein
MSYLAQILAQKPTASCYDIWDAIRERHFRQDPAPDDESYWRRVLALSPGERAVILAIRFSEQVHNGGFSQFFLNGGDRYAYATAEGIELLGFLEMAKFLRRAIVIAHIPDPQPPDYEYHVSFPEEGGEDIETPLANLTGEFFDAYTNKDWEERITAYVRAHPDEFV